jgi:DNA-binding MarR family transcriptional regulator
MQTGTRWIYQSVLNILHCRGYDALTEPQLSFLASLDCGATQASKVAERLGITRQAVYRTTTDLQKQGFLTLETDHARRNQKQISMTKLGMKLVDDARDALGMAEAEFARRTGLNSVEDLRVQLDVDLGNPLQN